MDIDKIIIITGITASGKTKLAIDLAIKTGRVIINFDSRQYWKNIKNLSCSPSEDEKNLAKHLLFNEYENDFKPSLGFFIKELQKINEPKILVGGSIFYVYSLLKGVPIIEISDKVKNYVMNLKNKYEELMKIDKNINIHKNDIYRIERFLEFYYESGCKFEDYNNKYLNEYEVIKTNNINFEENIIRRTENNFDLFIDEIRRIEFVENFKTIIGYEDCISYINGEISKEICINNINQKTIKYAKYQLKFLKKI